MAKYTNTNPQMMRGHLKLKEKQHILEKSLPPHKTFHCPMAPDSITPQTYSFYWDWWYLDRLACTQAELYMHLLLITNESIVTLNLHYVWHINWNGTNKNWRIEVGEDIIHWYTLEVNDMGRSEYHKMSQNRVQEYYTLVENIIAIYAKEEIIQNSTN